MKLNKLCALSLLFLLLLLSSLNFAAFNVEAQGNATVIVLDSVGGTVTPSGTHTYSDGTPVTLTATPSDSSFIFSNWVVSSESGSNTISGNPLTLNVKAGVTYTVQAVFKPLEPTTPGGTIPELTTAAIVVVLASGGGTTNPSPNTYALENAASLTLTAIPNSGWQFSHWVISGDTTDHGGAPVNLTPTDNPYNINHGYGYTFSYQAVFSPVGGTEPTPIPEFSSIATIVIALALVAVAFGTYAYRRNTK